ncbi:8-amino-3,8-dideoxy-alpha-D-manno-octulosonate transaminase [Paenibacillus sp. J31TS4]|uniref:DegT/DnrJ/EryC1/StrS family aminotransferase n=1 Tax=Paenibacillus sp. J31TS4 TaxID=2807195 RepID=UPI001B28DA5B|nr:DegT/DnrJ/EryC1/StrS family aminotransferase [Paenibacillus sp. J31TS4]GIP39281.1 8-amino-3,8-dideoxy-alpha-D-manno-octulosonate transaminase [Paenibacillus sp. J31TS4]
MEKQLEKLALDGGKPARSKPLPPNYPGAVVMGEEEAAYAERVIRAQSPFRFYGANPLGAVDALEERMMQDLGVPYALGVTSCTAALVVALKALGIGYGDKVIVPAVTFLATPGAVVCANAVPVFADVDESLNLDPSALERVIDDEVKAIITVPILGNPCDMDPILAVARKHGIPVIEDVAQSLGTSYRGKPAGTLGELGVYSFQMNKILTAGEGGAVVTRDAKLYERAARYHDQGLVRPQLKERFGLQPNEETDAFVGQNYRMSEVTGAILVEQWNKLEGLIAAMKSSHRKLKRQLEERLPGIVFRSSPDEDGDIGSNLGLLLPTAEAAGRFMQAMAAENITAHTLYGGRPVYMVPQLFHQRTAEKDSFPFNAPFKNPIRYTEDMCPRAVDLIPRMVFVPISPLLTDEDLEEVTEGIVKVYRSLRLA